MVSICVGVFNLNLIEFRNILYVVIFLIVCFFKWFFLICVSLLLWFGGFNVVSTDEIVVGVLLSVVFKFFFVCDCIVCLVYFCFLVVFKRLNLKFVLFLFFIELLCLLCVCFCNVFLNVFVANVMFCSIRFVFWFGFSMILFVCLMVDFSLLFLSLFCVCCFFLMLMSEYELIKILSTSDKMTVDKKIYAMVYRTTMLLLDVIIVFYVIINEFFFVVIINSVNVLCKKFLNVKCLLLSVFNSVKSWNS